MLASNTIHKVTKRYENKDEYFAHRLALRSEARAIRLSCRLPASYAKLWASRKLLVHSCATLRRNFERLCPMAISEDLLEILACPACKAKVELKPDGSG